MSDLIERLEREAVDIAGSRYAALFEEAAAALRAQQPQPIATAPRDGTMVWLFDRMGRYIGVWKYDSWHFWEGEIDFGVETQCGSPCGIMNGWLEGYGPTHWLPLPTPPQET